MAPFTEETFCEHESMRYKIGTEVKHLLIRSHVFTLEQPIDVHRVLLMNAENSPAF